MSDYVRFGKYLRLDKVESNFYADTYKAKFFGSNDFYKMFYLNEISSEIVEDKNTFDTLVGVIKKTSRLTHSNILKVLDLHNFNNKYSLLTEYFPNDTLLTLMNRFFKNKKAISPAIATYLVTQICDAIHYAHNEKILHGNISPVNIIITHEGLIKIKDFSLFSSLPLVTTMKNLAYKQFRYFSPEYLKNENLSPATDIYSLSVVLYEILTGSFIYNGKDAAEIVKKVKRGKYRPILEVNKRIPKELAAIIEKGLSLDPSKRFQNVSVLKRKLLKFLIKGNKIYSGQNFYTLISKALKTRIEKEIQINSTYQGLKLEDYKNTLLHVKKVAKKEDIEEDIEEVEIEIDVEEESSEELLFDNFNDQPYVNGNNDVLPEFNEEDFIPDIDENLFEDEESTSILYDEADEASISSLYTESEKSSASILPDIDNISNSILAERTATNISALINNPKKSFTFDLNNFLIGAGAGVVLGIIIGMIIS